MATRTWAGGSHSWSQTAAWVEAAIPTAADDVIIGGSGHTTGTLTIDGTSGSPSLCKSIDCTSFTGTLSMGATAVLAIGGSTSGAVKFVAGMSLSQNTASIIKFVSTSGTNNITWAGQVIQNAVFDGVGGSWQFQDTFNGTNITLTNGSLDTNGKTVSAESFLSNNSNTRTLTCGATIWDFEPGDASKVVWDLTTTTGLTFTKGTATWDMDSGIFNGGGLTYNSLANSVGFLPITINGNNTFSSWDIEDIASITLGGNQTITGTCLIQGTNAITNRILLKSDVIGTPRTLSASTFTFSNIDLRDITKAGAGSGNISSITGLSGDCGGNSGWTFTTPISCYMKTAVSVNWSASNWFTTSGGSTTARVPLPQDTAIFDANSVTAGSKVITVDVPRMGSVNWTGVLNTPKWAKSSGGFEIYGSITMVSGMTQDGNNTVTYAGQGSNTWTSGTQVLTNPFTVDCGSGTLTISDASSFGIVNLNSGNLTTGSTLFTSTSGLTQTGGVLTIGSGGATLSAFSITGTSARTVNMGSGNWTFSSTGTVWDATTTTNLTLNAQTSTIIVSNTAATAKTFVGGGLTYNNATWSGDNITISGSNIFSGVFAVNTAGLTNGLKITQGTTQTLNKSSGCFITNGSAGNLAKLLSSSAGNAATLTAPNQSQISVDYMSIKDSTVTQSNTWYAGANSTNVSGNTRWIFTVPPAPNTFDAISMAGD